MATVTIDEKGLLIDGRRRWIVGGLIDPARIPSAEWPARLDAAAASGLNTITVPAAWRHHEPLEGQFRFDGDHDVARFVRLAGERRLMVILRPGPFLGNGWDRGAIPAWVDPGVHEESGRPRALRSSSPAFLSAAGAWIRALAEQVGALQASRGGPIVLIQNEHRWFCGDADEAEAYLGELARRLRENGLTMPIVNTNNLYASAEGELEAWNGFDDALSTYRQLRAVRPQQPALALDLEVGRPLVWGQAVESPDPDLLLHTLAQALAAGAQPSLGPFAGGSRFGFSGGRLPFARGGFVAQSADDGAPLDEAGRPTAALARLRPLLLFASSFERLLATIEWSRPPACLAPGGAGVSVIDASGDAGHVVFLLTDPDASGKRRAGVQRLLLPDGRSLEVDLRDSPAVWCLLDAPLERSRRLDYASASVLWHSGDALALMAPAGATVSLSVGGSALELQSPRGKAPETTEHEGLTIALLNSEQAAVAIRAGSDLLIGARSEEAAAPGWRSWTRVSSSGEVASGTWGSGASPPRATVSGWSAASSEAFATGASERYAVIDGPADLTTLGVSEGYGWLRLTLRSASARRPKALLPESADRVHVYVGGRPVAVVGVGPGASEEPFTLPLAKGDNTIVLLAENLGRPAGGWSESQRKGVWGHLHEVKAFKAGKPALESGELLRPLDFRTPLTRLHDDDRTRARRVTWSFMHRRRSPLIFRLGTLPAGFQALLVVNGEVIDAVDEGSRGVYVLAEALRQGKNAVQLAVLGDPEEALAALAKSASFHEGVASLSEKAEWSFARWERPDDRLFEPCANSHDGDGAPIWRRATFSASPGGEPLGVDLRGLTKGQAFLNGRHLGRYFERTAGGASVGGQRGMWLPASWLVEGENTLTIFDEHGAPADKCRIAPLTKIRGSSRARAGA